MQTKFIQQAVAALAVVLVSACGGGGSAGGADTGSAGESALSAQAQLGAKIFVDPALSASGKQSCQSCHDPARAHGAPDSHAGQPGGKDTLPDQGGRSSPSIRYLKFNTAFYFDKGTPTGGFFWDGRASSIKEQAGGPFLNPAEMANDGIEDVVRKLAAAPYAGEFRKAFGDDVFSRPQVAYDGIKTALQAFQQEDSAFAPFSSKYDAYLEGRATLTAREASGLKLFNALDKGNCAACHPSARAANGSHPLFTDFTYDALGVPRNTKLKPVRDDPSFHDLGLCERAGFDKDTNRDLCGAFKVPSLRNVALRGSLFHNGVFTDLKTALSFYVTRDTHPERWYPLDAAGEPVKFNDLPPQYRRNVNVTEPPYNRQRGGTPALSDAEIDDVIAFLHTLTDGYYKP